MLECDEDDPDARLVHVPYATLDLEAVPTTSFGLLQNVDCLPGLILDQTSPRQRRALGHGHSNGSSREIALRVLSSAHYRVRRLRIVFLPAKRPSRLEVYVAPACQPVPSKVPPVDVLSQYHSADFRLLGDPFMWPPESVLCWPLTSTEVVIPLVRPFGADEATPGFIKLVMNRIHAHPDNYNREIAFSELELLGTFQLPGRDIHFLHNQPESEGSSDLTCTRAQLSIRHSLTAAGLPDTLVQELIEGSDLVSPVVTVSDYEETTLDTPCGDTEDRSGIQGLEANLLDSPFDLAMRDFVDRETRLARLLASIEPSLEPRCGGQVTMDHSLSIPRIAGQSTTRLEAIAIHTFGSFFTQCLLNHHHKQDESEYGECVESLRLAERLAPLLSLAGFPTELAFEGLVAAVALALQSDGYPLSVFHTALHLTRTIFQARTAGFCLVHSLSKLQLQTALCTVLESVLDSRHCWTLRSKTTVDRELLTTMRMLVTQRQTRAGFLQAITSANQQVNQDRAGSRAALNRLRVMRWLLQRHSDKLSSNHRASIESIVESLMVSTLQAKSPLRVKQGDLARQCFRLLDASSGSKSIEFDTKLLTLRKHLQQGQPSDDSEATDHIPLFEAHPFTPDQQHFLVTHLQQYFRHHHRPTALYQHEFNAASLDHINGEQEIRKGNIVFRGLIEERHVPKASFHLAMDMHTKPFEFTTAATPTPGETAEVTMESSFARFRGTLEVRGTQEMTSATTARRAVESPVELSQSSAQATPRATLTRHVSQSKLNRVVPVVDTNPIVMSDTGAPMSASTVFPTISTTNPTVDAITPPLSEMPAVGPAIRASTAAPAIGVTKTDEATPSTATGASVRVEPSTQAIQAAAPKTAPPSSSRKSQDAGCALQ